MDTPMSQITRQAVLEKKRERYARAGKEHKTKILTEVVALFACHRKAASRATLDRLLRPARVQQRRRPTTRHLAAPPGSHPHGLER